MLRWPRRRKGVGGISTLSTAWPCGVQLRRAFGGPPHTLTAEFPSRVGGGASVTDILRFVAFGKSGHLL